MHLRGTLEAERNDFERCDAMQYGSWDEVTKQRERTQSPSARILSAFCSEMPLIASSTFFGVYATASTVCSPASASFLQSWGVMPASWMHVNSDSYLGARATDLQLRHKKRAGIEAFLLLLLVLLRVLGHCGQSEGGRTRSRCCGRSNISVLTHVDASQVARLHHVSALYTIFVLIFVIVTVQLCASYAKWTTVSFKKRALR